MRQPEHLSTIQEKPTHMAAEDRISGPETAYFLWESSMRNLAILVFDTPKENRIDYTHAYIPLSEFNQYNGDEHTIVVEKDGGYIGVKSLNSLSMVSCGPTAREFVSCGRTFG